jgi:DNA-binding transcriptional regulator PaaX
MKINPTRQKVLLLLYAGVALGFAYSPNRQYKILQALGKEWRKINEKNLKREIRNLYRSKLIKEEENSDGTFTYILTDRGKVKALTFHFREMKIEKKHWDGKWRVVIFDIPEKIKMSRNALRDKLKNLGFRELQKSVFIFPYECKDEIDFIIEFFKIRKYVRYGTFDFIDNDLHLRKIFNLLEN